MPPFRCVLLFAILLIAPDVRAISTILNYQGSLTDGGLAANGPYDFQFQLTDNLGNPIGAVITVLDVDVVGGVFTTRIDFLDSFGGADTKLEISVRTGGSAGAFTTLSPSTPIDPTPYAQVSAFSEFAASAQSVSDNAIDEPGIATGAVSSRTIAAAAITSVKLAPAAVTNAAIADGAVNAQKIASLSITNAQISSGTIGTAQLAVNAVTTAEIAPNSVKLVDLDGVEGTALVSSSLLPTACADQTTSLPGAVVGDYPVLVLQPNAVLPSGVTVTALNASAANSVIVRICNFSSVTVNLVNLPVKLFTLR
jgi:hypothetical protein